MIKQQIVVCLFPISYRPMSLLDSSLSKALWTCCQRVPDSHGAACKLCVWAMPWAVSMGVSRLGLGRVYIQDSPESIRGWSCTAMCSCTRPMWVWGVHRSSAVQCEIDSCIGRGCSGLSMLPCQPPYHIGSDSTWIQARILWINKT